MFNLNASCTLKKVSPRRGSSDDSNTMVDLVFWVDTLPTAAAMAALGHAVEADVRASFFRTLSEDADQNAIYRGLKSILTSFSHEGKHAITVKGMRRLRCYKLSNVSLVPNRQGQFGCTFKVTLEHPPEGFIDTLSNMLQKLVLVKIEQDGDLFDAVDAPDAPVVNKDLLAEQEAAKNKKNADAVADAIAKDERSKRRDRKKKPAKKTPNRKLH